MTCLRKAGVASDPEDLHAGVNPAILRLLRSDPGPIRSLRQLLQGSDANALNPQRNLTQVPAIGPEAVLDEMAAAVVVDDQRAAGAGAVAGAGDEYARQ